MNVQMNIIYQNQNAEEVDCFNKEVKIRKDRNNKLKKLNCFDRYSHVDFVKNYDEKYCDEVTKKLSIQTEKCENIKKKHEQEILSDVKKDIKIYELVDLINLI
jgi:hypothetical protein